MTGRCGDHLVILSSHHLIICTTGNSLFLQVFPKLITDHLQLDRFQILTQFRLRLPLHADLTQVVHQLLGHPRGKGPPCLGSRLGNGCQRGFYPHAFHVEAGAHAVVEIAGVGVEAGDVILAQGEDDPEVGISAHGVVELLEEGGAVFPTVAVVGQDLFKLVDDQHIGHGFVIISRRVRRGRVDRRASPVRSDSTGIIAG